MAENTLIEWATHTFNPWIGCTIKSAGCKNCYAKTRWADELHRVEWGPKGARSLTTDGTWALPLKWNREAAGAAERPRVFCASLADVFDDHSSIDPAWRRRLFDLISKTQHLEWLLLTKRPENWITMLPVMEPQWPFTNVRLGISIEDQDAADERGPFLQWIHDLGWPTFVSYGPAIGPVNWAPLMQGGAIDWMVAEGESGKNARISHPDLFRAARDACAAHGVPFHLKQWGEWRPLTDHHLKPGEKLLTVGDGDRATWMVRAGKKLSGRMLDGIVWDQFPAQLKAGF